MEFPYFEKTALSPELDRDFAGIKINASVIGGFKSGRIILSGAFRLPLDDMEIESEDKENGESLFNSLALTCVTGDDRPFSEKAVDEPAEARHAIENGFITGFFSIDLKKRFPGLDLKNKHYVICSIQKHTSNVLETDKAASETLRPE